MSDRTDVTNYAGRREPMANAGVSGEPEETARAGSTGQYEPPNITYLGTLRELTRGGTSGPDGGAGGFGSL
jgi:hypothetical protein